MAHIGGSSPRHPRKACRGQAWRVPARHGESRRGRAGQRMEGGWMVAPEFDSPAPTRGMARRRQAWHGAAGRGMGARTERVAHTDVRVIGAHARPGAARYGGAMPGEVGHGPSGQGKGTGGRMACIEVRVLDAHVRQRPAGQCLSGHGRARRGAARQGLEHNRKWANGILSGSRSERPRRAGSGGSGRRQARRVEGMSWRDMARPVRARRFGWMVFGAVRLRTHPRAAALGSAGSGIAWPGGSPLGKAWSAGGWQPPGFKAQAPTRGNAWFG